MHFNCPGQPGHGSLLLENTAGEKVNYLLNRLFEVREQEKKKLDDDPNLTVGDVITINLTQMRVSTVMRSVTVIIYLYIDFAF